MPLHATALALLFFAAPPAPALAPLDAAKQHLSLGKLDDVLFDLDGKTFVGEARADAAAVLAEASRAALDAKDAVLSLQFAQMALKLDKAHPLALEMGARASLGQKQYDPAEDYADRLVALDPKAARPRLLRAEIALDEGEWTKVVELTRDADPAGLSRADRARLLLVLQAASKELSDREEARKESKALQRQLELQMNRMQKDPGPTRTAARGDLPKVVVYSTAWCGYCKRAKAWFNARKIPFTERDVENDAGADGELQQKQQAAGVQGGGVPWIDVGGQLVHGFDVAALERLFPGKP